MKIYIILDNGYNGLSLSSNYFYLNKEKAEMVCKKLNRKAGNTRTYYFVEELEQHTDEN